MTPSRPLSAAAASASVRKVRGLGVIETVIGRFTGLIDEVMRCIATDLDPAAVESADMDSRGMIVELAMLDSPEFAGGDEVAVAHHVELEPEWRLRVSRDAPCSDIAGKLAVPIQRKKALVDGSVFVNREEWIRSPRCAPSLPSRKREASVLLRRSSISCHRSSPSASRSSNGSWARRCFTARPARLS